MEGPRGAGLRPTGARPHSLPDSVAPFPILPLIPHLIHYLIIIIVITHYLSKIPTPPREQGFAALRQVDTYHVACTVRWFIIQYNTIQVYNANRHAVDAEIRFRMKIGRLLTWIAGLKSRPAYRMMRNAGLRRKPAKDMM